MITHQHSLQTYFLVLIVKTKHHSCQTPKPCSFFPEELQSKMTRGLLAITDTQVFRCIHLQLTFETIYYCNMAHHAASWSSENCQKLQTSVCHTLAQKDIRKDGHHEQMRSLWPFMLTKQTFNITQYLPSKLKINLFFCFSNRQWSLAKTSSQDYYVFL